MTVLLTGGFDPVHPGHIATMRAASQHGGLAIGLNSDSWLRRKKGYVLIPFEDRKHILEAFPFVERVFAFDDSDGSAADAIRMVSPEFFWNGGDRSSASAIPESEVQACEQVGAILAFSRHPVRSSSEYVRSISDHFQRSWEQKLWGRHVVVHDGGSWRIKLLNFGPGGKTSVQRHMKRSETLKLVAGSAVLRRPDSVCDDILSDSIPRSVAVEEWHQIVAGEEGAMIVEVQQGEYSEDDIERRA